MLYECHGHSEAGVVGEVSMNVMVFPLGRKKKKKEKILSDVEPGVSMGKGNKGGKVQGMLRREVGFCSSALEQGEDGRLAKTGEVSGA